VAVKRTEKKNEKKANKTKFETSHSVTGIYYVFFQKKNGKKGSNMQNCNQEQKKKKK